MQHILSEKSSAQYLPSPYFSGGSSDPNRLKYCFVNLPACNRHIFLFHNSRNPMTIGGNWYITKSKLETSEKIWSLTEKVFPPIYYPLAKLPHLVAFRSHGNFGAVGFVSVDAERVKIGSRVKKNIFKLTKSARQNFELFDVLETFFGNFVTVRAYLTRNYQLLAISEITFQTQNFTDMLVYWYVVKIT